MIHIYVYIIWNIILYYGAKAQESRTPEGGTVAPCVELEKPQAGAPWPTAGQTPLLTVPKGVSTF